MRRAAAGALLAASLTGPALAQAPAPAGDAAPAPASPGRLSVTGRASREVAPDFATVEVAVESRGPSPAAALDQNSAGARKVIDLAREFGIGAADLSTAAISLRPLTRTVRDPNGQVREVPDGYQAGNAVTVRVRDLSRLGALVRRVLDGGADRIGGIGFGLADPARAENEARAAAVRDALRQAETLAEAAGVRLGRIEAIVSPPRSDEGPVRPSARAFAAKAGAPAVPVEPGTLDVSAAVEVTWTLAP
ncbi:26 kDa periplasmic immunogenic protein [Methylobacterium crusticola]|uniref:26 kDa periplasmic immunogenic protein n=1 Tax=Methylobacterium crusticola TaxID=1697972 RepID=A0ABQ4QT37_9HYPH|nr:SIMPL domain-containing protein [Methylobacterium crusticola]GJD48114.1 26 kDa periplasmic immunogenic protein [Methylobacterium crusticola]